MSGRTELEDIAEHMERYRAVTLKVLDMVADDDLGFRPSSGFYSLGQQLLHIAQAEDLYGHGLFEGHWDYDRVRFPPSLPGVDDLRAFFERVREFTRARIGTLAPERLAEIVTIPGSPIEHSLRSWLWFLVEHEMHHKAQIGVYLRLMGRTPPFYAMPLAEGERPDIQARQELGGF